MTHSTTSVDSRDEKTKKSAAGKRNASRLAPAANGEILVKGVAMGIIISAITHVGRRLTGAPTRHPLTLFSTGVVAGYVTHKYRKEIITVDSRTAEKSKNVLLRQKENLSDLFAEIREESGEKSK